MPLEHSSFIESHNSLYILHLFQISTIFLLQFCLNFSQTSTARLENIKVEVTIFPFRPSLSSKASGKSLEIGQNRMGGLFKYALRFDPEQA